jgi:hypothetical protein
MNGKQIDGAANGKKTTGPAAILGLLILVILAGIVCNSIPFLASYRWVWVETVALEFIGIVIVGYSINGYAQGILIDNRNRMSLSKFQMIAWTVLVTSALITFAASNLHSDPTKLHDALKVAACAAQAAAAQAAGVKVASPCLSPSSWGALDITVPIELYYAMGISAATFVAAPSLLSLKMDQDPKPGALEATAAKLGTDLSLVDSAGKVFTQCRPGLASWTDLFRGDEVGNAAAPDLGKIQQFIITVLLLGTYASAVWGRLAEHALPVIAMPALSSGFIVLMGISHASYLAYKVAPHTQSASDGSQQTPNDPRKQPVG